MAGDGEEDDVVEVLEAGHEKDVQMVEDGDAGVSEVS